MNKISPINRPALGHREVTDYLSPAELSLRWKCSRSSVDRIARRAGFTRLCLGTGRNGMVRYLRKEVDAYEGSRTVVAS
jgi:hypothetical protein